MEEIKPISEEEKKQIIAAVDNAFTLLPYIVVAAVGYAFIKKGNEIIERLEALNR